MEEERGRRSSPERVMRSLKKVIAWIACAAMVCTGMPAVTALAADYDASDTTTSDEDNLGSGKYSWQFVESSNDATKYSDASLVIKVETDSDAFAKGFTVTFETKQNAEKDDESYVEDWVESSSNAFKVSEKKPWLVFTDVENGTSFTISYVNDDGEEITLAQGTIGEGDDNIVILSDNAGNANTPPTFTLDIYNGSVKFESYSDADVFYYTGCFSPDDEIALEAVISFDPSDVTYTASYKWYVESDNNAWAETSNDAFNPNELNLGKLDSGTYNYVCVVTITDSEENNYTAIAYITVVVECSHVYSDKNVNFVWSDDYSSCEATFTCTVCGEPVTVECKVESASNAATCEKPGTVTHTATATIGEVTVTNTEVEIVADALGHDWDGGVVTIKPTCTDAGEITYTCRRCDKTETKVIKALGHDYVPEVTNPTCTEKGYTTYTCSRCKASYIDDYTDALGHVWSDWEVTKEATETENGERTRTCSRCGAIETEIIPAKGTSEPGPQPKFDVEFSDLEEKIVMNEDNPDSWVTEEVVSENTPIEFEITTTLPVLTEEELAELAEGEFTMVFHIALDDQLKMEPDESDLHITIGGETIDPKYYTVDINPSKESWSISTLSVLPSSDGCTFHVTVDLAALYNDGVITADDFTGKTELTVFFYADLEGAEAGETYASTVWYNVYDNDEIIFTSKEDEVHVSVSTDSTSETDDKGSVDGSNGGGSSSHGSSGSSSSSRSSSSSSMTQEKSGKWILEGALFTYPDGTHPSNCYLNIDGEIWAFYTNGFAVNKSHTQYYTDEAIAAAGNIPTATGTWEVCGWWYLYDDGTYPANEWAQLTYNGQTYWYYFDVDGWMVDGWLEWEGNTYYLDPVYDGFRGHMVTGWQLIDGVWYYFESNGVLFKNGVTPDGYTVDANGAWIE